MINTNNILFGTGSDTYYITFTNKYVNMLTIDGYARINDTASNIYLTRIINIGLIGLSSFLIFMGSIISLIKKTKNLLLMSILLTIVSYLIQGLYNLEVVIVTPIFYCLLAIYVSAVLKNN